MNRAKFSTTQVIGLLLFIGGIGGLIWQSVPRSHAIPSVPLAHLGLAEDHAERAAVIAQGLPKFRIVGADGTDNSKKNVRLWEAMTKVLGSYIPNIAQEIGDCVSWGQSNAINYLQPIQMLRGPPGEFEFKRAFPPFAYGTSRVQVGQKHGSHFRGDGSVGAYAAEAARDYGILRDDHEQCPKYSGSIAKQWGDKGPPKWALDAAKDYVVQTIAQVNSADDARDAIVNGYPVTIASGWWGTTRITAVDGRMVATHNTSWGHQQCLIGYDGSSGGPYFYCLNSWGPNAHPAPLQGEPPGGYWIRFADVDHICKEGDSWAFSGFDGFPSNNHIDWDQLLKRGMPAPVGNAPILKKEGPIMDATWILTGAFVLLAVMGIGLFLRDTLKRIRWLQALAAIVGLVCVDCANAQSPDFAAASSRHLTSKAQLSERLIESPLTVASVREVDWTDAADRSKSVIQHHDYWPPAADAPFGLRPKVKAEDWHAASVRPANHVAGISVKRREPQALFFTAVWCGVCKGQKSYLVEKMPKLGYSVGDIPDADFRIVDFDTQQDLVRKYEIKSLPTLIYLDRDGNESKSDRIVGPDNSRSRTAPLIRLR